MEIELLYEARGAVRSFCCDTVAEALRQAEHLIQDRFGVPLRVVAHDERILLDQEALDDAVVRVYLARVHPLLRP